MSVAVQPAIRTYAVPPQHQGVFVSCQVVIAVDACCEIEPAVAADLGLLVIPRELNANRRKILLDADRTLHHSCWPQPLGRFTATPYALGELVQLYEGFLRDGVSVLALHLPECCDGAVRIAAAARSILLASESSVRRNMPRVAVCELGAVGTGFSFLVATAARAAREGMSLQQLLTLVDHLHMMIGCSYFTGPAGPVKIIRGSSGPSGFGQFASQQLWEPDRAYRGAFVCRAASRHLARRLFAPGGALHGKTPACVRSTNPGLLDQLNTARVQTGLPRLEAQSGGVGLTALFPQGCVELTSLPEQAEIDRVIGVIQRFQPAARQL